MAQSEDYCQYGEICFQVRIDRETTVNLINTNNQNVEERNLIADFFSWGRKMMRKEKKKSSRKLAFNRFYG